MYTKIKKYGLNFKKSITRWDEAIPLGNGILGSLIYGAGPIIFSVDRIDLWDERKNPTIMTKEYNYENLVKYASGDDKAWQEKLRIFESANTDYPSKLSAGRILFDFGITTENLESKLDICTAEAQVTVNVGDKKTIKSFICATENVGVVKVEGDFKLEVIAPKYFCAQHEKALGYPETENYKEDEYFYYVQKTRTEYCFGVFALVKDCGDYKEVYYTVATTDESKDIVSYAKDKLKSLSEKGYDALFLSHKKWWKKYWQKSTIEICDEGIERLYYRSWYLFASTSRENGYPMPLQGVWTADEDSIPPWHGDYHHDTNTQLSYQGYLKANRIREGKVFVDYIWNLRNTFKKFAKDFYGVDGYIIPGTSTLKGQAVGGWVQFSLSPTLTIWVAQSFVDYYLYTDDKKFLKNVLYPFLCGVGKAIRQLLVENNGKLELRLSTSPEIYEDKQENFLRPNTNFDLSLLIYLYSNLSKFSKELEKDSSEYDEVLNKLDDIAITDDGVIMLNKDQVLPFSHRHFSHLMCLYPLHIINYDTEENKHIYEQSMLQIEQLGTGWWVGFSFPVCAQLYAMMHNGDAAAEKLKIFEKAFVSQNGFHLNGDFKKLGYSQWHYRPFTLEALFAYCDALQEMLLQDHKGYVDIFPSIPDEWKEKCEFKDLRVRGNVLVSANMKNSRVEKINFIVKSDCQIKLKCNFFGRTMILTNAEYTCKYRCGMNEIVEIKLLKGKNYLNFK